MGELIGRLVADAGLDRPAAPANKAIAAVFELHLNHAQSVAREALRFAKEKAMAGVVGAAVAVIPSPASFA